MEQTINTVQAFMKDVDRLVVREMRKPVIKKSNIERIRRRRKRLEQIDEPFRSLAIRLLDEVLDFSHSLNADGMELADKYARKVFATLDEIGTTADEVSKSWHLI